MGIKSLTLTTGERIEANEDFRISETFAGFALDDGITRNIVHPSKVREVHYEASAEEICQRQLLLTLRVNGSPLKVRQRRDETIAEFRDRVRTVADLTGAEVEESYEYGELIDDVRRYQDKLREALRSIENLDPATPATLADVVGTLEKVVENLSIIRHHDRDRREWEVYSKLGEGYCRHGVYVGGCGVDLMCQACESDED